MKRLACVVVVIVGCGGPPTPSAPVVAPSAVSPSSSSSPAPPDLATLHKTAYAEATSEAESGHFDMAIRTLTTVETELARQADMHRGEKLAYWIHNELTWLYWAQRDLAGALAETMQGAAALDRSTQSADEVESMRLHALWDRAYLLLDMNDAHADEARADYDALARGRHDHDGMAVLEAFFLTKRKHGAEAAAAAKRVDVEKDEDLQDLYVIALAFDAAGDRPGARSVRERICTGHSYLMKPLIVARMRTEGFSCP